MQLVMLRESLKDLPPVILPHGYMIRHFMPGDETHWERIMDDSFGKGEVARKFNSVMGNDAACSPERILFICYDEMPIATASAWYNPNWGLGTGYLHYVGVCSGHQGKKLGYSVSLAAMHRCVFEGRSRAVLQTDDHRVSAIKTYLKLGFVPWLVEDNQRKRWRTVLEENGFTEMCPDLKTILSGGVHIPSELS
ncbi:MAG: GNAT family N-acetyltransferase [Lentisphaerae bacterium]|jgi:mycothiol synthase|nr:GNAT family N-acetyltransferase [Lentisphaerota bacterium]